MATMRMKTVMGLQMKKVSFDCRFSIYNSYLCNQFRSLDEGVEDDEGEDGEEEEGEEDVGLDAIYKDNLEEEGTLSLQFTFSALSN